MQPTITNDTDNSTTRRLDTTLVDVGRQVILMSIAALLYFGVRAITKTSTELAVRHGNDILEFEQWLHIDAEVAMQRLIIDNHRLVTAADWMYMFGHWPVILTTFVWLYSRHRYEYRQLRNAMFISGAIGLVVFWRYPVAPPRLTTDLLVDTVAKYSQMYRTLQPPSIEDRFASLPSLHVGWNLLVGVAVARTARHPIVRLLGAVSPLLMAVAVVVTANHYIVDVIAGSTLALFGLWASTWITPRLTTKTVIDIDSTRTKSLEALDF